MSKPSLSNDVNYAKLKYKKSPESKGLVTYEEL